MSSDVIVSEKTTPSFSVIVPTYNQAHYLSTALDSLLAQTNRTWEAIIVNDGSKDNTPQVMEYYARKDSRFKLVHKSNGGVATALNEGLRHASGEWICWLSSDDLFEADKLEVHASFAADNPSARFMYTNFSLLYDETGILDPNSLNTDVIPSQELQVLQLFRFNYINGISIAIHRDIFRQVGYFNESLKYGQDYDMWLRISAHIPLYFINKHTSITRVHPNQDTNSFAEAGIYDSCQAGLNFLNKHGFKALFPFCDLMRADHVQFAIQHTVSALIETAAYINRCGMTNAIMDRMHEWLYESAPEIRTIVMSYLADVSRIIAQSGLPENLRMALSSLELCPTPLKYQQRNFFEVLRHHLEYVEKTNHNEASAMRKYISCFANNAQQTPLIDHTVPLNRAEKKASHYFRTSALANNYCVGKGLEIGGAAHNPFGLNTLNVDFSDSMDTVYKQEEIRVCGKAMPVDIVAFGDNIPLPDESQDFIVSSHVLEHFPNPVKALQEWDRLLKPGGIIFMIVPHKERTFDSVQPRTTLQHIIDDYYNNETEPHVNPQGHDHCWITEDIVDLCKWMIKELDMQWDIIEIQDVDDKVGNGFTIVIRKNEDSLLSIASDNTSRNLMPRSVLLVVHGFPPTAVGGVEVYTQSLASEMALRGIKVTVLYPVTDSSEPAYSFTSDIIGGITLTKFHVPRGSLFIGVSSQEIDRSFGHFLRSQVFDLVHFHHIFVHMSISMVITAKEAGIPVAITLHDFWFICPRAQLFIEETGTVCSGPESPAKCAYCITGVTQSQMEQAIAFRQEYVRTLLLKVDLLFTPSHFVAELFSLYRFGGGKIVVAPLGIGTFAAQKSVPKTDLAFGYIGTIHPVKNVMRLIDAFSATRGQARLDMYGGGESFRVEALKESISDPRITYHGSYAFEQLPEIFSKIDVLVVPSLIESYCFTVREALSVGIPVLAANVGGIPEIICDGVNGVLFDPFDKEELTRLLQRFISDRYLLQELNGKAFPVQTIAADADFLLKHYGFCAKRQEVLENYSFRTGDPRHLEVYRQILTDFPAIPPVKNETKDDKAPTTLHASKLKIGVHASAPLGSACPQLRLVSALTCLHESGKLEFIDIAELLENEPLRFEQELAGMCALILQRSKIAFWPYGDFGPFLEKTGTKLILEIDDALTHVPETNSFYEHFQAMRHEFEEYFRHADLITVSTPYLKKLYSPYNKNVIVLPNCIDTKIWKCDPPCEPKDVQLPLKILFSGTPSHVEDFTVLRGAIRRILEEFTNEVELIIWGNMIPEFLTHPSVRFIENYVSDYSQYAINLADLKADIGIVPLQDNVFNNAKSAIKWLEYSVCGIAGIFSNIGEYKDVVSHGKTGLIVANNEADWYAAIKELIVNRQLRTSIARDAYSEVMAKHTVIHNAHKWLEAYRSSGCISVAADSTEAIATSLCESKINTAISFHQAGQFAKAEPMYRNILAAEQDNFDALHLLGVLACQTGRLDESLELLSETIRKHRSHPSAFISLGNTLTSLGRYNEAAEYYQQALELEPNNAGIHYNLGNVLHFLDRNEEAVSCYQKALTIRPDFIEVHNHLGNALRKLGRLKEAEASLRLALQLNADVPGAHNNLGNVLMDLGRLDEAEASFRHALELKPNYFDAHSNLLFVQNYSACHDSDSHLELARSYGRMVGKGVAARFASWDCPKPPKHLRVGLVSGDFNNHPVGFFLEDVLAHIDTSRIELIAYCTQRKSDDLTARIMPLFSEWRQLEGLDDESAAHLIHKDCVHVLIDLAGHTAYNRLPVFAWKPAPVQVSWLGYSSTTGVPEIDYILGNPYSTPVTESHHFTEAIWQLPETSLCFSFPNLNLEVALLPVLSNGFITFGCFNNLAKLNDGVLSVWASILKALPTSRLFLKNKQLGESSARMDIINRFAAYGVSEDRLLLEGRSPRSEYLKAYNSVDIILDPFPFPGGTTTVEGLWMGVPFVTKRGDRFISHQGEMIAQNTGLLSEWIANDHEEYVAKALYFSSNQEYLAGLRTILRRHLHLSPLFDAQSFARHLEQALWGMWDRFEVNK